MTGGAPDPLETVRRRLVAQRLTGAAREGPADAVRWLLAVQAQEFAEAKWALSERAGGSGDVEVEEAFARGDILRTHVLRPTWHFVAREDLRWLLRLTRSRVHARNRLWYERFGADAGMRSLAEGVFARALGEGGALTRAELMAALAASGIEASGPRMGYLLMHAELEEVIVSGPRRGKQQTYALLDERAPAGPRDGWARDRALAELAARYARSRGPATARDLAWWSGLTVADAREGLERAGDALEHVFGDSGARAWYAAPAGEGAAAGAPRAFLLGMYDEMHLAYRDLRVVMATQPPRSGLLDRPIVVDGQTVGSWRRTLGARAAVVEATLFAKLARDERAAVEEAVARFGRFLGLEASLEARQAS